MSKLIIQCVCVFGCCWRIVSLSPDEGEDLGFLAVFLLPTPYREMKMTLTPSLPERVGPLLSHTLRLYLSKPKALQWLDKVQNWAWGKTEKEQKH